MNEEETKKILKPVRIFEGESMIIPRCCREGWESCPHVARKKKSKKSNVGL